MKPPLHPPPRPALADIHAAWRRGILHWKLDTNQRGIYDGIHQGWQRNVRRAAIEAARKVGKSYLLWVVLLEIGLKSPNRRGNYCGPTAKLAKDIAYPIVREIAQDAPKDCRPRVNAHGNVVLPNGFEVVVFGCDDQVKADRGRGPSSVVNVVDEAGFVGILDYVLGSVLNPQTLRTGGPTIIASTPPLAEEHPFCTRADAAKEEGSYYHRDIYSNAMMTRAEIDAYVSSEAADAGLTIEEFKVSTTFKREFLAQRVTDSDRAVIPTFTPDRQVVICQAHPRRQFVETYAGIDLGYDDPTGCLWGWWDYQDKVLVIDRELLVKNRTTEEAAKAFLLEEKEFVPGVTHRRWMDDDKQLVADWNITHGIAAMPTAKQDRDIHIDNLRRVVARKEIRINPDRCPQLIRQVKNTLWNRAHTDFERTKDGHGDLLMALVYLNRNVDRESNPVPADYGLDAHTQWINPGVGTPEDTDAMRGLRDVFGGGD